MNYRIKLLPATAKCFADESIDSKEGITSLSMLHNERLEFQLAYQLTETADHVKEACLVIDSPLKDHISACRVEQVPVSLPTYPWAHKDEYLRTEPGLYPDLLLPMEECYRFLFSPTELRSLFFFIEDPNGLPPGDHAITLRVTDTEGNALAEETLSLHIVDALLPESELIHTQWFHTDCLATYYELPIYSEEHWIAIENFAAEAVRSGINMILTPVLTPPLDTAVGEERPTVQLVDITLENGAYHFGFERLDRWVATMTRVGIRYFEICHLFTQWGCQHAPKVMATVDGEYRRIFGWETDASGEEYRTFLRTFLRALVAHFKELGIDHRCYYHISDEPSLAHLPAYTSAKHTVKDILAGYPIIDALSDYDFYKNGVVEHPIPSNDHLGIFLENKVPDLWTYYCCGQCSSVSNRFVAMPGANTRILGAQLFKFDIVGFLQWGFNFYNCQLSRYPINPYLDTCAEYAFPAGDSFSVYPGRHLSPYRSLHGVQFTEALTDLRALRLCASLIGKEKTVALIEEGLSKPMTFEEYPVSDRYLLSMRDKVNHAIETALSS